MQGTAAKTPRTSRKAVATPRVDRAALLSAAAGTPLPAAGHTEEKRLEGKSRPDDVQQQEEEEEEEEQQQPCSTGISQRRLSATPKQGRRSAAGADSPQPPRQPAATGLATPAFCLLLLLLGALAAGLAALAVPYCQQHDCAELAHNLPELASDTASAAYGQARAKALLASDWLLHQWRLLVSAQSGCGGGRAWGAASPRWRCRQLSALGIV